jgi:hypothetical protein
MIMATTYHFPPTSGRSTEELLDQLHDLGELYQYAGWKDGEGEPISAIALHLAAGVINSNRVKPYIYATTDGGIDFEWDTPLDDCIVLHSLSFYPDGNVRYFYTSIPEDGPEQDKDLISPSIEEIIAELIYDNP